MKLSKNKRLNLIFLVILALLIGFYFLLQQPTNVSDKKVIKIPNPSQINKIEITKNASTTILIKKDDSWLVKNNNSELPANKNLVDSLIKDLSASMNLEKISVNPNKYNLYELDDAQIINLKVYQDEKLVQEIGIGKMGVSYPSSFVKLTDDSAVYQVNNTLTFLVRTPDWLAPQKKEENDGSNSTKNK